MAPKIDKYTFVALLACSYILLFSPLFVLGGFNPNTTMETLTTGHMTNKIVWPVLCATAILMALQNRSRLTWPPHIAWLFAYVAFCAASVLWAYSPSIAFSRLTVQILIIVSIVIPINIASRKSDAMYGLYLCFVCAIFLNIPFVLTQTPILYQGEVIGFPGYFLFKGILGECAAIAFLLSLYELLFPGRRRIVALIVIAISVWLTIESKSKGSLAMGMLAPMMAYATLAAARRFRISPAAVLAPIPIAYIILANIPNLNIVNRISYHLYGNYTLSGRKDIWDFVSAHINFKPLLGWGFQSFWMVGTDAPSYVNAPGWIRAMPFTHNGYLNTIVETGYAGFALFMVFLFSTLYAVKYVASRDPTRAWLLLSVVLFVMLTNTLESVWMAGGDLLWMTFLVTVAEIGRYWQPSLSGKRIAPPGNRRANMRSRTGLPLRPAESRPPASPGISSR